MGTLDGVDGKICQIATEYTSKKSYFTSLHYKFKTVEPSIRILSYFSQGKENHMLILSSLYLKPT